MTITIYQNGEVFVPNKLIGFVGETAYRSITFDQPTVAGATGYKFRIEYSDGLIFEIPIVNGVANIDGSVLRESGKVKAQWIAYDAYGVTYTFIAKSKVFELVIGPAIGDDVKPIPTYEAIMNAATELVEEGMTREEVITAIDQIMHTGEVVDLDTGFVTTLKEQNNGVGFKVWLGTTAEYNAIQNLDENTLYIRTDDTSAEEIRAAIAALQAAASDTGWRPLTISGTGFTAGSITPQYRRIGSRVYLRGQIVVDMDAVADVTTVFATLPEGYRPSAAKYQLLAGEGDRMARLYVRTGGGVNINYFKEYAGATVTGSHWLQLDCEFLTD